jgi:hypothetical protein
MSSDEKEHDLNQAFKKWDRKHREPTSPESEEEVYVIPDAERKRMRLEEALQRGVNGMFEALRNKARQKAYDAEYAAIKAEFGAELASVVAIAKPAATPDPPADPPTPKILGPRIPAEKIGEQSVAREQQSGADAAAEQLSTRLKRGKLCEEMAGEIKTIRGEAITNGKAMFEIRQAYPEFLVWNAAKSLLPEDLAVFEMPTRWGAANGYANRFLSKLFPPKSPSTVNDWRKEFRAHKRQKP